MVAITLNEVTRRFGEKVALDSVSLEVPDKEFLVLLGPSGCGKSTLLRIIAGLESLSEGSVLMDDRRVDGLEPADRDLAFVFQSYALYPHMTVERNIAFPLIMADFRWWYHLPVVGWFAKRRLSQRPETRRRVQEIAHTLQLTDLMRKHPGTLSGGQRQRVAVARAMVRDPRVFLMDEPLSNLDAQLRTHMRTEIVKLHKQVDATFVYVTHDQTEAMTMGTRIVVMRDGVVQQVGTPREVFERPNNVFVARFIGNPSMNIVPVRVETADSIRLGGALVTVPATIAGLIDQHDLAGSQVLLGVRPEAVRVGPAHPHGVDAVVSTVEHLGSETLLHLRIAGVSDSGALSLSEEHDGVFDVYARLAGYREYEIGTKVGVTLDFNSACLFDAQSEERYDGTLLVGTGARLAPETDVVSADR